MIDLNALEQLAAHASPMPYGPGPGVLTENGFLWLNPDAVAALVRAVRAGLAIAEEFDDSIAAAVNRWESWTQEDYDRWNAARTAADIALAPFRKETT